MGADQNSGRYRRVAYFRIGATLCGCGEPPSDASEPSRIVHDAAQSSGKARGINYIDASGEEVFQPADLVILSSWTLSNNRLLLLSGAGIPCDPATGKGTLGKNFTHQVSFPAATSFFEKPLNRFMGAGGIGTRMSNFDGDALASAGGRTSESAAVRSDAENIAALASPAG